MNESDTASIVSEMYSLQRQADRLFLDNHTGEGMPRYSQLTNQIEALRQNLTAKDEENVE